MTTPERARVRRQASLFDAAMELQDAAFFARHHWVGLGVYAAGAPRDRFAEVWWPGYVRQPVAPRVVFVIGPLWPGQVRGEVAWNARGQPTLHLNAIARFNPHGRIAQIAPFAVDKWLTTGDELRFSTGADAAADRPHPP